MSGFYHASQYVAGSFYNAVLNYTNGEYTFCCIIFGMPPWPNQGGMIFSLIGVDNVGNAVVTNLGGNSYKPTVTSVTADGNSRTLTIKLPTNYMRYNFFSNHAFTATIETR